MGQQEEDPARRVVGLALKADKARKHLTQELVDRAAAAGLELRLVDCARPLEEQGPFDVLLQKLRDSEWEAQLEGYLARHPEVRVCDHPAATRPLRNRAEMLAGLEGGGWRFEAPGAAAGGSNGAAAAAAQRRPCRVSAPPQTMLAEGTSYAAAAAQLAAAGLAPPLVAKPLWADGRPGSHALAILRTQEGLRRLVAQAQDSPVAAPAGAGAALSLPVAVQPYIEHGGCLFKVYVLGERAVAVTRASLQLQQLRLRPGLGQPAQQPQQQPGQQQQCEEGQRDPGAGSAGSGDGGGEGAAAAAVAAAAAAAPPSPEGQPPNLELVERVSAYPRGKAWGKADLAPEGHGVAPPPDWLLQALAARLRAHLGLSLFNFDVIVPAGGRGGGGGSAPGAGGGVDRRPGGQEGMAAASAASAAAEDLDDDEDDGEDEVLLHLIDINYFPGYEKLAGYEGLMVDFLLSLWPPPCHPGHADLPP